MRRQHQSWNFSENDHFNIEKSQDFIANTQPQEQFPFKIGSNFIQDDSQSISFIQSQKISIDYFLNHINGEENSLKEEPNFRYSQEQIMKVNKLNSKIRLMILFEIQFKEQIKKRIKALADEKERLRDLPKNFIQRSKKRLEKFTNDFSTKMQPIKISRISMITPQKRFFFLNKKDKSEVNKRKYIQILISEKDLQLQQKSGLLNLTEKEKDFKSTQNQAQNYIQESVSLIDSNQLRTAIKDYVHQQLSELKEKIKNQINQNRKITMEINQEIKKLITNLANNQQTVNHYNLVKEMEFEKNNISNSETLLEVLPVKRLFSIMPNFKQENFHNLLDI